MPPPAAVSPAARWWGAAAPRFAGRPPCAAALPAAPHCAPAPALPAAAAAPPRRVACRAALGCSWTGHRTQPIQPTRHPPHGGRPAPKGSARAGAAVPRAALAPAPAPPAAAARRRPRWCCAGWEDCQSLHLLASAAGSRGCCCGPRRPSRPPPCWSGPPPPAGLLAPLGRAHQGPSGTAAGARNRAATPGKC